MTPTRANIWSLRLGAIAGVTACWICNILWVFFLLLIVPQQGERSLEESQRLQQISTIPLVETLRHLHKYQWLSFIIESFIILSISVSFITVAAGLKHFRKFIISKFKHI